MTDVANNRSRINRVIEQQRRLLDDLSEVANSMLVCEKGVKNDAPPHVLDTYTLAFEDTFDAGFIDPAKWESRLLWGSDLAINSEEQYYVDVLNGDTTTGANPFSFNAAGNLLITAAPITGPKPVIQNGLPGGQNYSSGVLTSRDAMCLTGGYVEVCLKPPCGVDGAWVAAWLLNCFYYNNAFDKNAIENNGVGNDKFNPEIDFYEGVQGGGSDMSCVKNAYHYFTGDRTSQSNHFRWSIDYQAFNQTDANTGANVSSFNQYEACEPGVQRFRFDQDCSSSNCDNFITVGVDWVPNQYMDFYLNGQIINCVRGPASIITDQSMYLILNFAVGGLFPYGNNGVVTQLAPVGDYPASLEIAYARMYTL